MLPFVKEATTSLDSLAMNRSIPVASDISKLLLVVLAFVVAIGGCSHKGDSAGCSLQPGQAVVSRLSSGKELHLSPNEESLPTLSEYLRLHGGSSFRTGVLVGSLQENGVKCKFSADVKNQRVVSLTTIFPDLRREEARVVRPVAITEFASRYPGTRIKEINGESSLDLRKRSVLDSFSGTILEHGAGGWLGDDVCQANAVDGVIVSVKRIVP